MGMITMSDVIAAAEEKRKRAESLKDLPKLKAGRRLHEIMPAGIWKGRRVFILGGGTSLKGFDFSKLEGEIVISINRAFEHFMDSAIMLAQDARLWGWYEAKDDEGYLGDEAKKKWDEFRGFKTWINCQSFPYPEDLFIIDVINDMNPDWDPSNYTQGLPIVGNSGLNALMLATVLGASEIYLLGFDMYGKNGQTANFHGGYKSNNQDTVYKDNFIPDFQKYADVIRKRTRVINLNPQSELKCFEFGKFEDLKPIRRPVLVSFFTEEYAEEAKRLEASARRFGYETDIQKVEKRGNWLKTIYWRADFILQMLEKHKRDVVWIDSDAEMCQYPDLFENFNADFGAHWAEWPNRPKELLGGTMYFAYSPASIRFVKLWIRLNAEFPNEPLSQNVLRKAHDAMEAEDKALLESLKGKAKKEFQSWSARVLPAGYCQIFDLMADKGEPVIHHYQASRKYRDG